MENTTKRHEPAKETAKKIRKVLKVEFPGIKFSVRTEDHGTLHVSWTDGPCDKAVNEVVGYYEGKSFDGMTDSTSYHYYKDPETGDEINGAGYIFCERELSDDFRKKLETIAEELYCGVPTIRGMDPDYHRKMVEAQELIDGIEPLHHCREDERWVELFKFAKETING